MKLFSHYQQTLAVVIAASLFLFSCQKEATVDTTVEATEEEMSVAAEESAVADGGYDDAETIAFGAADAEAEASASVNGRDYINVFADLRASIGACAGITVTPNDSTYPKTITIDFGDHCVGLDGKVRSGKIVIHLTAPIRRFGAVATITFVNYYVNAIHLEGTKVITNLSANGAKKFSIRVINGKVTGPNGRGYVYESFKLKTQIAGFATLMLRDDVYAYSGNSKTRFSNGLTIKMRVQDPLIKKLICRWISEGTLGIMINDRVFKLDYGFPNNGNCDNKALLTWNNGTNQRIVILP